MPAQATISPNIISSILLALKRMSPSSPKHVLPHLIQPKAPYDYNFLDAFATLCSFFPHCESASAAIHKEPPSDSLYIAITPSDSTLRTLIDALIHALPPGTGGGLSPSSSPGLAGSVDHADGTTRHFIIKAYLSCHRKLLDAVDLDDCTWLLEYVSTMSAAQLRSHGINEKKASLEDSINSVMSSKDRDPSTFSDTDFFSLHQVSQTIGEFSDMFLTCPFVIEADRISRAVNTIITWATSRDSENLDVIFVHPPNAPDFLLTTNMGELMMGDEKALYEDMSRDWKPFEPPRGVSEVEGHPGYFTGHGAVHCESALLHHILDKRIPVHPYIGCSHPICYPCLMLLKVCGRERSEPFTVGRRSVNLKALDAAWSCPPMGTNIYKRLERNIIADFKEFCLHADDGCRPGTVSLVNDGRDLVVMMARYLDFVDTSGVEMDIQPGSE